MKNPYSLNIAFYKESINTDMNISFGIKYRANGQNFTTDSMKTQHLEVRQEDNRLYVAIVPETNISIQEFSLKISDEYNCAFDTYFKQMGASCRENKRRTGYTTWYNYYGNITQGDVMRFNVHTGEMY